jgi:hypothetical protein
MNRKVFEFEVWGVMLASLRISGPFVDGAVMETAPEGS